MGEAGIFVCNSIFKKVQTRRQYPTLQCFCAVKVPLPAKACDTKAGGQARMREASGSAAIMPRAPGSATRAAQSRSILDKSCVAATFGRAALFPREVFSFPELQKRARLL
jgi:hypothetical protein